MDSILFWNAVALEANRVSHSDPAKREQTGPALSSRALAIVHLAMYDGYAGVANDAVNFPRYFDMFNPVPAGTSGMDAVAGAAFTTLTSLYPAQKEYFEAQLTCFDANTGDPNNNSFLFGVEVGKKMLLERKNDAGDGACGYKPSPGRGRHRVDPDNPGQGFSAPFYGSQTKAFAVATRYSLDPPPFGNPEYLKYLKQVREKGIKPELTGTLPDKRFSNRRSPDESLIGVFWSYDGSNRLGTPPRFYNLIVRLVAINEKNDEGQNARLFAFVNAAMGDAGILAWEQKYCHDFWRPVIGIREHDESFGPAARNPEDADNNIDNDADPLWLPFGAQSTNSPTMKNFTPNFPAYPSGHATFGAAAFHVTRLFYGKGFKAGGTPVIPGGNPIIKNGNLVEDDLFDGLGLISEELNGMNTDNLGTIRPRHVRNFDFKSGNKPNSGGLGKMIIENGISRVYLGVHWSFDAFLLDGSKPDFSAAGLKIGGVSLGLKIAEDIFKTGGGKAPKLSTTTAPPVNPPEITQPYSLTGCAEPKPKSAKNLEAAEDRQDVQNPFPGNISRR